MEKPKFNNRPNPHVINKIFEGNKYVVNHDYWISRAPAVVGIVFAFGVEGGSRVLVIQRSKNMREEPLKFGAPSGYLDWDETGFEGMTREVYEETSLYLPTYENFMIFNNNKQPFFVQDDPKKDKNQNVSLTYLLAYDFYDHQDFFPKEIERYSNHETMRVEWLKLSDFFNESREWAFNHDERIVMAHKFFNNNFTRK
jgi:8-oxo-dGTP pyrophosphatase MutT (NUDIX family)